MLVSIKKIRAYRIKYGKKLQVVPAIFTFLNATFGFLSIIKSFDENYTQAIACLLFCIILDFLDGKIARLLNCTSDFGCELDSLSDAISFCIAPLILLYSCIQEDIGLLGAFAFACYMCAGIGRLAKFNSNSENNKKYFVGMPTTLAALILIIFIVYNLQVKLNSDGLININFGIYSTVLVLAFLMVAPIKIPKLSR